MHEDKSLIISRGTFLQYNTTRREEGSLFPRVEGVLVCLSTNYNIRAMFPTDGYDGGGTQHAQA